MVGLIEDLIFEFKDGLYDPLDRFPFDHPSRLLQQPL